MAVQLGTVVAGSPMVVVFLLVVIALLLYLRQSQRDYTLSAAVLIAALTWLSIEIHLLGLLHDVMALALDHWLDAVMVFCAVILLIVPAMMIYVGIRDQLEERDECRGEHSSLGRAAAARSRHTVLDKYERRVATLRALGYGRTEAEATALHQMKRDMSHSARGERTPHNS